MWLFLLSLIIFCFPVRVEAIYDPLSVLNNKFGMHIADFNDIGDVAQLVNSSGGDWGYITLVSTDHDRDMGRWQHMFDQMRRLHVIPLVRIATHVEKDYWVKPNPVDFDGVVSFFNSLNWPTQNRYVILYNEPNHAKEWGDTIDPEGYAKTLVEFGKKFKAASEDFFILPAGLDVSAASDNLSLDAGLYLDRMMGAQPDLLNHVDGWNSHSYPNPGFSGSVHAVGRGTLMSYNWELAYLKKFESTRDLPIFITETGWTRGALSSEEVGSNLFEAAAGAWSDSKIVAITPFVFNYQDVPFELFSWKRRVSEGGFYPQYDEYKSIEKTKGQPRQKESYTLTDQILPPTLVSQGSYSLKTHIINNGQGILSPDEYEIALLSEKHGFTVVTQSLPTLEPKEKGELTLHVKAPLATGTYGVTLLIKRDYQLIVLQTQSIRVVPPPSLIIYTTLGWRNNSEANDVTALVYDEDKLLHKFPGLTIKNGQVGIQGLADILPGRPYRVVLLVPYYLPRQIIAPLTDAQTSLTMKRFLPLDFDLNGKLDISDIVTAFASQPKDIIKLFVSP